FDLGALRFELGFIGFGDAQRLVVRQQEIAREAIAHLHDIADAAEIFDAFQQNEFHGGGSYCTANGSSASSRARLMAIERSRCFFAETAVMRAGTILPFSEM